MIESPDLDAMIAELRAGLVEDAIGDQADGLLPAIARAYRDAIRRAARIHRKSGRLEASIDVQVAGSRLATTARVTAGEASAIIVRGSRPHEIEPLHARALAFAEPAQGFAAHVMHPGTVPDPFIARGAAQAAGELDALADDAAADAAAEIAARLEG